MNKDKLASYSFYLWLLIWPWQTKLILSSAQSNYLEISIYISWFLLLIPILVWGKIIFSTDYWRFNKKSIKPIWWWGLIVWELAIFASIFWAENSLLALYRYGIFALVLSLFYLVKGEYIKEKLFSTFFIIGLIPPALLAIWQFLSQKTFAFKWLGLAEHSVSTLGTSVVENNVGRYLRAYGSFDHPNVLGGVMAIALIYILFLSFKKTLSKKYWFCYLSAFAVLYSALLVSFSRSALLVFFISAPLVLIIAKKPSKKLMAIYILLILIVSLIIVIPNKDLFLVRAAASSRLEQKSLDERVSYLTQAISIIKTKPIQGVGLGNYVVAEKTLDKSSHEAWFYQPVHNYWLLLWSEIGIIGLGGALVFWIFWFDESRRKNIWPLFLVFFILSFFDHWLWTSSLGLVLFFMMAAVTFREDN